MGRPPVPQTGGATPPYRPPLWLVGVPTRPCTGGGTYEEEFGPSSHQSAYQRAGPAQPTAWTLACLVPGSAVGPQEAPPAFRPQWTGHGSARALFPSVQRQPVLAFGPAGSPTKPVLVDGRVELLSGRQRPPRTTQRAQPTFVGSQRRKLSWRGIDALRRDASDARQAPQSGPPDNAVPSSALGVPLLTSLQHRDLPEALARCAIRNAASFRPPAAPAPAHRRPSTGRPR